MTAKGGVSVVIGQQNGKKEKKSCSVKLEQANLAMMMKKIFLTIASVALMSNSNVWALTGGPFDNGDPGGLLMERGSFYQCQFSFKNGNGYGIFTPDSYMGGNLPNPNQAQGGNTQQLGVFSRGSLYTENTGAGTTNPLAHNANRSVFYYKGLTYVGGCFGFVDAHAREIQGSCNANSNETLTQSTLAQGAAGAFGGGGQGLAQTQQPLVTNGAGLILNVGWTGKITTTRPNMRFRGKGELAVQSLGGSAQVEALTFDAYQGLINAIIQSTSSLQNAPGSPVDFQSSTDAVNDALDQLSARLGAGGAGPDELFGNIVVESVRVTGNRRFF
jgi:hypothetical protein